MPVNRRKFLRDVGLLSLASIQALKSASAAGNIISKELIDVADGKSFTLSILQTTDVHCQVYPHDELFWENGKAVFRQTGGYAQLATFFKQCKKNNPNSFFIDTGDMFQGSELSYKTTGEAMVPILNEMGYDLFLPGNWEVIYYKAAMQKLLGSLNAPKICANMYHDKGDGSRGDLIFPPYYIWKVRDIKIGFIGYTDPLVPLRQPPNLSKGIIYARPEESLSYYVDKLRKQEGCSYLIILAHLGLSQQISLANMPECEGVDYILGGDTHERVRQPIVCKYAKVVEPGAFGSFVGKLDLTVKDGKVIKDDYSLIEIKSDELKADEKIARIIKGNEKPFADGINRVVGYSTIPLYRYFVVENPIDTFILDAFHWKFPEVDIMLSNGFRFCPPRTTPDHTGNIPITEGYLYDMLPLDSRVRTGKVSGRQIREWLEKELNNVFAKDAADRFGGWLIKFRGMELSFYAYAEKGKRISEVKVGGQPLDDTRIYSIGACEREGDPEDMLCRIKNVKDAANTNYHLHEVLRTYLESHSPVTPVPPQAARILDGPQHLLTQVSGVDYEFR